MFPRVFDFIVNCIKDTFGMFKKMELSTNFTYYDFLVGALGVLLLIAILRLIKSDTLADMNFEFRQNRYDQRKYEKQMQVQHEKNQRKIEVLRRGAKR